MNPIVGADDPDLSPAPEAPYDIHGPAPDDAAVEAWADDHIRFDKLPAWQRELRTEIEEHLLDHSRAVLGPVPRLVAPYGNGVKWDPSGPPVRGRRVTRRRIHDPAPR